MAKNLRLLDRLLLGLALLDEFMDMTVGAGNRAYHMRKLGFWTPPNYKGSNLSQNIYRMLKAGYLEKKIINNQPQLVISSSGKNRLSRNFSYFKFQEKKWDGFWRLVIFDIQEKERDLRRILRDKLKELGFGMWQKSIYISPHAFEEDMVEFLKNNRMFGKAYVLTTKHYLMGEAKELANKVWQLNRLNDRYEDVLDKLDKATKIAKLKKVCYDYIVLLREDPCLPKELLPNDWLGDRVKEKISSSVKLTIGQINEDL